MLARLAERGILRKVEAISTVSGGSIIGAVLYIHLKNLLENRPDAEITDADYVRIVREMETDFLAGVEQNVRARGTESVRVNLRMRKANYSRSDRMGELYDEVFYRPAWDRGLFGPPAQRVNPAGMIQMRDLAVRPADTPTGERNAAVPILIVNATSLNTGHNWRFLSLGMGEDPRLSEEWVAIDKNKRLETSAWEEIPPHQQTFELGLAVAASACVPGLFHPLAVSDLFRYLDGAEERSVRVELVDGGVHDNQGVCGLIDARCTKMIVSDASGQMGDRDAPATRVPAAASRSSGIYGDRVREEQLAGLLNYRRPAALVHLKKGLPARIIPPLRNKDGPAVPPREEGAVGYGVEGDVQELLSAVRTDLDAFSEIEAYSLACFGYNQATADVEVDGISELATADGTGGWSFLAAKPHLAAPSDEFRRHLEVAQKRFRKALVLGGSRAQAKASGIGLAILICVAGALAPVVWALVHFLGGPLSWGVPLWATFVSVAAAAILAVALAWLYLGDFKAGSARARLAEFVYSRVGPVLGAIPLWALAEATRALGAEFVRAGRFSNLD